MHPLTILSALTLPWIRHVPPPTYDPCVSYMCIYVHLMGFFLLLSFRGVIEICGVLVSGTIALPSA